MWRYSLIAVVQNINPMGRFSLDMPEVGIYIGNTGRTSWEGISSLSLSVINLVSVEMVLRIVEMWLVSSER